MHRNSLRRSSLTLVASLSLLGACGPSDSTPDVTQPGPDGAVDAAADTFAPDAAEDVAMDSAPDASPDVTEPGPDAAVDAPADTSAPDAAPDASTPDASADAAADAGCPSVTIAQVQTTVFAGCTGFGCHDATTQSGGLNLTAGHSAAALVGVHASIAPSLVRVVPGDVANSFLWHKLTNMLPSDGSQGVAMPRGEGMLPTSQLDLVRCWIETGAH
jgi:hypothetical protein